MSTNWSRVNLKWQTLYICVFETFYLTWLQNSPIDSAETAFSEEILFAKGARSLFHLPECEYRWSIQCSFHGSTRLILELPQPNRLISPWNMLITLNISLFKEWKGYRNMKNIRTWIGVILGLASSSLVPCRNQSKWHGGRLSDSVPSSGYDEE